MKTNTFFWKNWSKKEQGVLWVIIFAFAALCFFILNYYFKGHNNVIHWNSVSELNQKIVSIPAFSDGTLMFNNNSLVYYIKTHFLPSIIEVNRTAYYLFLMGLVIGSSLIAAYLAKQKGIGFFLGLLILALTILSFRLETVFNISNSSPFLISFFAIALPYYFLGNFAKKASPFSIFIALVVLFSILLLIINLYSEINRPFIAISSSSMLLGAVLFLIFTFLIAHELIGLLVIIISRNSVKGENSLTNFVFLSSILLINLLMIYLENAKYISESAYIPSPIYLYIISAIIGLWGFRNQLVSKNYSENLVFLYLGLALASSGFITAIYGSDNDSFIEASNDSISILFFTLSLGFIVYVLLNFRDLLKQGLPIEDIVYKPPFFRWVLIRGAALFLALILIGNKNLYTFYVGKAGYSNALADFYLDETDLMSSEVYLKDALEYDPFNHKSNYTLGSLALTAGNKSQANFYFDNACQKNPSPYAYAAISQSELSLDQYFKSWFSLKKGIEAYPKNAKLLTNAAYMKQRGSSIDSVYYYLNLASENCSNCEYEESNLQAFWIENAKTEKLDSVSKDLKGENQEAINKILMRQTSEKMKLDSVITVEKFASYYNNMSVNPKNIDIPYLEKIKLKEENVSFAQDLNYLIALGMYNQYQKVEGLKRLLVQSETPSLYGKMLAQQTGTWFLQEGVYDYSINSFERAGDIKTVELLNQLNYREKINGNLKLQADALNKSPIDSAVLIAPLNPYVLQRYNKEEKDKQKVYDAVFEATELNPNSAPIWKEYCLLCLDINSSEYAEIGLNKLKELVSPSEYSEFNKEFIDKKRQMEEQNSSF